MLMQRIITAIILIPITLALLFFLPPIWFAILTGFVTLLAAWEWSALIGLKNLSARLIYVFIILFFLWLTLFMHVVFIFLFTFLCWLIAVALVIFYPRASGWWSNHIFWRGVMGVIVLVPCWVAMNFIRNQSDGIYALLFLFVLIWGADSTAYFFGKAWGKHKLAPRVSPGKSIQGLVGALLFAVLSALVMQWIAQIPQSAWIWGVVLALITVLFSVVGDLFESMLKRQAGVKDSGQIIPGHGGLLDRIDSLTAAAPIFALGAILLGMYLE